jgi:hypothetical protein
MDNSWKPSHLGSVLCVLCVVTGHVGGSGGGGWWWSSLVVMMVVVVVVV